MKSLVAIIVLLASCTICEAIWWPWNKDSETLLSDYLTKVTDSEDFETNRAELQKLVQMENFKAFDEDTRQLARLISELRPGSDASDADANGMCSAENTGRFAEIYSLLDEEFYENNADKSKKRSRLGVLLTDFKLNATSICYDLIEKGWVESMADEKYPSKLKPLEDINLINSAVPVELGGKDLKDRDVIGAAFSRLSNSPEIYNATVKLTAAAIVLIEYRIYEASIIKPQSKTIDKYDIEDSLNENLVNPCQFLMGLDETKRYLWAIANLLYATDWAEPIKSEKHNYQSHIRASQYLFCRWLLFDVDLKKFTDETVSMTVDLLTK